MSQCFLFFSRSIHLIKFSFIYRINRFILISHEIRWTHIQLKIIIVQFWWWKETVFYAIWIYMERQEFSKQISSCFFTFSIVRYKIQIQIWRECICQTVECDWSSFSRHHRIFVIVGTPLDIIEPKTLVSEYRAIKLSFIESPPFSTVRGCAKAVLIDVSFYLAVWSKLESFFQLFYSEDNWE